MDQLFVMGDHRSASQDSRHFGPIERSTVDRAGLDALLAAGGLRPDQTGRARKQRLSDRAPPPLPRNDGPAPACGPNRDALMDLAALAALAVVAGAVVATASRDGRTVILGSVAGGGRGRGRHLAGPELPGRGGPLPGSAGRRLSAVGRRRLGPGPAAPDRRSACRPKRRWAGRPSSSAWRSGRWILSPDPPRPRPPAWRSWLWPWCRWRAATSSGWAPARCS